MTGRVFSIAILLSALAACTPQNSKPPTPDQITGPAHPIQLAKQLQLEVKNRPDKKSVEFTLKNLGGMPLLIDTSWQHLRAFVEENGKERPITEDGASIDARYMRPEEFQWIMPGEVKTLLVDYRYGPPKPGESLRAEMTVAHFDSDQRTEMMVNRDKPFFLDTDVLSNAVVVK